MQSGRGGINVFMTLLGEKNVSFGFSPHPFFCPPASSVFPYPSWVGGELKHKGGKKGLLFAWEGGIPKQSKNGKENEKSVASSLVLSAFLHRRLVSLVEGDAKEGRGLFLSAFFFSQPPRVPPLQVQNLHQSAPHPTFPHNESALPYIPFLFCFVLFQLSLTSVPQRKRKKTHTN